MAVEYFWEIYDGTADAQTAFDELRTQALYDYGHRGYTGTIAEKESFEITHEPMRVDEALRLVQDGLPNKKWGPAGCIQLINASGEQIGFIFYGMASA